MSARILYITSDRNPARYALLTQKLIDEMKQEKGGELRGNADRFYADSWFSGEVDLPHELASWLEEVGDEGVRKCAALLDLVAADQRKRAWEAERQAMEEQIEELRDRLMHGY